MMAGKYDVSRLRVVFGLGADAGMLLNRIATGEEEVIVIDTIRSLLGFKDEKDNTEVASVLTPFVMAARAKDKTLIFVHHNRKGGGEHGEGISGAHAFLGTVDRSIEMSRDTKVSNRRLISGMGRLVVSPEIMYERTEEGEFKVLGDPKGVQLDEVKKRVKDALDIDDDWRKVTQIHNMLDEPKPSENQVREALALLARESEIERDPPISEGPRRGMTYRYRRMVNPTWPTSSNGNSEDLDGLFN